LLILRLRRACAPAKTWRLNAATLYFSELPRRATCD
jgi:hypothetical protein